MNISSDIKNRLNAKTIHEVRMIARAVGAHSESSQKSSVIEAIMAVAENRLEPQPPSKRGAPPKSDNADLSIVADIKSCREFFMQLDNNSEEQNLSVADSGADRKFSSLTHIYPDKLLTLDGSTEARIADFFAPLVLGQRVFVTGGGKSGKTTCIKSVARAICADYHDIECIFLMLNARPEEVTHFERSFTGAEFFAATFDMPEAKQSSEAMLAFESAKQKVEEGLNAIIFVDGLFDGYISLDAIKKFLFCACNAEEGGSLTIIATLPENYSGISNILNTASSIIALSDELSKQRIFPAIDAKRCYLDREGALRSEDEISAVRNICKKFSAEQIIELFKTTNNNEEIIEKYKNG